MLYELYELHQGFLSYLMTKFIQVTKKDIKILHTHFRSCRRSLAFSIVMSEVVAAGMMMIGVREPMETAETKKLSQNQGICGQWTAITWRQKSTDLFKTGKLSIFSLMSGQTNHYNDDKKEKYNF